MKRKRLRGKWGRLVRLHFSEGWSRGVSRALMFPGQETLSPSYALYLFACSPIFIRLYLKLELVPLHFLLRSSLSHPSLSLSLYASFFLLSFSLPPLLPPLVPYRKPRKFPCVTPLGADAVTTTCKHSGICNSNAAK